MPGKVNPVIPEAAAQAAIVAIGQDASLTMAAAMGNLELSQFMPLIADALLGQMEILREADDMLARHCVTGMTANAGRCRDQVANGTAAATALVEKVGYRAASAAIALSQADGVTLREAVVGAGLLSDDEYDDLVSPESATRLGSADKETK
jgi:aspartate ammonia-lyase